MYTKKIKIFEDCNYKDLESKVNEFLAKEVELGFTVLDIKYQQEDVNVHSCLIYYSEYVNDKAD